MPELFPHPVSPHPAGLALFAWISRPDPRRLDLRYHLRGDLGTLRVPSFAASVRRDGLWRHLCFECFIAREGAEDYLELNFSPSGEWAAYAFNGYRAGMRAVPDEQIALHIESRRATDELVLEASVTLPPPAPGPACALQASLCAVIESADGGLGYWSLAHSDPERPDFHRLESFIHAVRN